VQLFSIGEICRLLEVKPHVLRYWEQEFEIISPRKDRGGKRQYSNNDLNNLFRIKHLLHDEKYTIEGAKKRLWNEFSKENIDVKVSVQALRETLVNLTLKIDEKKKM
jgi:DNA-binding transcriptional MerR regulator